MISVIVLTAGEAGAGDQAEPQRVGIEEGVAGSQAPLQHPAYVMHRHDTIDLQTTWGEGRGKGGGEGGGGYICVTNVKRMLSSRSGNSIGLLAGLLTDAVAAARCWAVSDSVSVKSCSV